MKRILMIATGGTIASRQTEMGLAPAVSPEELVEAIPDIRSLCRVDTVQVLNIDSTNIQPEHWLLIVDTVRAHYGRYDGFVITHGTDTMAYTAAALSYLIQDSEKPIVLTGAQRPMLAHESDAARNLANSFRFAAQAGVGGVYLVFDGQAIVGTRARKIRTLSFDAFESINFPVAARVGPEGITARSGPVAPPRRDVRFYTEIHPNLFLLKLVPGMEPDVLEYVGASRDAIIIEGYGAGGLPFADRRNFLDTVSELAARGKIIVLATQVMLEGSDLDIYEVGVRAMNQAPLLQTYDMTVEAVVAKLMWILSITREFDQVKRMFYTPVNFDITLPGA